MRACPADRVPTAVPASLPSALVQLSSALVEATVEPGLYRVTWTWDALRPSPIVVASRNWPDGSSVGLDAAVIAAGVTAESACPDGLSSASLLVHPGPGAMKMSP